MVMIKRILIPMAIALLMSGCATIEDPKAELIIAQRSFIAVVNSLSDLRDAEAFDDDEIENITKLILSGDRLLDMWMEHVILEGDAFDAEDVFYHVLGELIEYRKEGDQDGL